MPVSSLIAGTLIAGLLGQGPPPTHGPTKVPREYVPIPLNGNPEQMLAEFLKGSREDNVQKVLVEQLKRLQQNPDELRKLLDLAGPAGPLAEDPYLKELVSKFQVGQKAGLDPESALKGVTDELLKDPKKLEELAAKIADQGGEAKDTGAAPVEPAPPLGPDTAPENGPPEDQFARRIAEWLEDEATAGQFAEFLKSSPGFQDAMGDLMRSLKGGGDAGWLPKMGNWAPPLGLDWPMPKLPGLGDLPKVSTPRLPALPQWNVPVPRLGGWGMPRLPSLTGGPTMPSAPGVGSMPWVSLGLTAIVLLLLVLLARRVKWAKPTETAVLTPLPASPGTVTTRHELRALFDRLALARLGDRARPWNHVLVALRWSEVPGEAGPVRELTRLYERARYAPGEEVLAPEEQDEVRRVLAALYGAAP